MTRINQKPGPTARARKAKRGKELRYAKGIRATVAGRDGYCRLGNWEDNPEDYHADSLEGSECDPWRSEWAHFGEKKRARTRGMAPEARHTTAGSLMLCPKHHGDYDAGRLVITPLTDEGCDGPLKFKESR